MANILVCRTTGWFVRVEIDDLEAEILDNSELLREPMDEARVLIVQASDEAEAREVAATFGRLFEDEEQICPDCQDTETNCECCGYCDECSNIETLCVCE